MSLFSTSNELIHESSPYLLQHAHNPVHWHAWNEKTLLKARKENKLILISIGYATCHWCHVMEAESFEDKEVAKLMNQHFICIKVDREERPDVDQIYMDAVQLLTGRGGWPLHAIALPDTRPFWGGTYFSKQNWMGILTEIARIWEQEPQKIHEYAENLTLGIQQKDLFTRKEEKADFSINIVRNLVNKWSQNFDHQWGGMNRAPKFPLPNNYHFLLRFAIQSQDKELLNFVNLTLTKMAYGGIFDPIRGGFARYSTDIKWHVPHFEKMLYDNAQLVSLYSDAYLISHNELYREIVEKTLKFIENELFDTEYFGFYSALDADSLDEHDKKEEGAFYVWKAKELQQILGTDFDLFSKFYNINNLGYWEAENYVLIRTQSDAEFCSDNLLEPETFQKTKSAWHDKLYRFQSKRSHPFLDDKILTSWNAMMCKGFADAYRVFGNPDYLKIAEKNMQFILSYLQKPEGGLYRNFKNGTAKINAYLEDYATVIEALLTLHEVTLEEKYVHLAKQFTDYTLDHFYDTDTGFFFFTSDEDAVLIHRKADVPDDVIPSGNSIMARNLFKMSHLFNNEHYWKVSFQMLNNVWDNISNYPSGFSNWLFLASDVIADYYEIVISGEQAKVLLKELNQFYIPNKIVSGTTKNSEMPLLKNRFDSEKTLIFVCVNNTCLLPETSVDKAVQQINIHFNAE